MRTKNLIRASEMIRTYLNPENGEEIFGLVMSLLKKHEDAKGVDYVVYFRNEAMDSSAFGRGTFSVVGPDVSIKTIDEAYLHHLYDLPSQRQYAVAHCLASDFIGEVWVSR